MAEELEGPETGTQASGADPAAVALALNGADRLEANAYLKDQRAFIADQRHHLSKQFLPGLWEKWLGVLLRVATAFTGLAIAAAIAFLVWDAAHADGLVIEAFSVPPDLAAKGVTGQVVASMMLDKLTAMQNATGSLRPAKSYANNWGDDLKVEIPDTGISFGEAYRFLRGWLGHETRIGGEVYRIDKNIAVTVRAGGDSGATFTGPESDLDALVQKASEQIYGNTQPYRYANYLSHYAPIMGAPLRPEEAEVIFQRLTGDPNPQEQAWAWQGLGFIDESSGGNESAASIAYRKAIAAYPNLLVAHQALAVSETYLGEKEDALAEYKTTQRLLNRASVPEVRSDLLGYLRTGVDAEIANRLGDYVQAVRLARIAADTANNRDPDSFRRAVATGLAAQHDAAAARAYFSEMPPPPSPLDTGQRAIARLRIDFALENWRAVTASEASVETSFAQFAKGADFNAAIGNGPRLWLAIAKAMVGDSAGAQSLVAATQGDCYDCVRTRGLIAAAVKQWGRADYWFARAVGQGPSLPFAYTDWGQALLERGDTDGAIAKFTLANQKGPHFADPLEGWGEALMKQNRSDRALAKFAEAEKHAPNWGRLHLKWGEALVYAGQKDEAQKQFALAATLDLSATDKDELAMVNTHG